MGWKDHASKLGACWVALVTLLAIGLSACGSADESSVVVRIGGEAITKATVDHWTNVVRRGGAFTGFRGEPHGGAAEQRALALLISSDWLIGEAARQRLPVSEQAVEEALAERTRGPSGAEFRKRLEQTGQTVTGTRLELRAELALEAIRQAFARRAGQVTRSEIVEFYRRNPQLFGGVATRVVDIVENLPSAAAAATLVKRVGTGRRFARVAARKLIRYTTGLLAGAESKVKVDKAIFAARPGIVSQPMPLWDGWTVFVVRKVFPLRPEPLTRVRRTVVASLVAQRKREIVNEFAREYARRWVGLTVCHSGYVAPGCAQYRGRLGEYENPFSAP